MTQDHIGDTTEMVGEGEVIDKAKLAEWEAKFLAHDVEEDCLFCEDAPDILQAIRDLWKQNAELKEEDLVSRQAIRDARILAAKRSIRIKKLEAVATAAEHISHYFPVRGSAWNPMVNLKPIHPATAEEFFKALAALKAHP